MQYVQAHCSALKFADVKDQTIFNNFVYGSAYGIHFLKDEITGNNPTEMTVIGHGSDGCTYALFVEDPDKNTRITTINSELTNNFYRSGFRENNAKPGMIYGTDVGVAQE